MISTLPVFFDIPKGCLNETSEIYSIPSLESALPPVASSGKRINILSLPPVIRPRIELECLEPFVAVSMASPSSGKCFLTGIKWLVRWVS